MSNTLNTIWKKDSIELGRSSRDVYDELVQYLEDGGKTTIQELLNEENDLSCRPILTSVPLDTAPISLESIINQVELL